MALRIVNNLAAMNTQRWLGVADTGMKKSLERLSSGYRINRAADDSAGLAISQGMRADIASFKVASRNTSEATSLVQVAEGAMDQISNMLTRLKELATQSASSNVGSNDRGKIDSESNNLLLEIDRIVNSTEYSGSRIIDGSFGIGVSSAGSAMTGVTGFVTASGMGQSEEFTVTATTGGATGHDITLTDTDSGDSQTLTGVTYAAAGVQKDVTFNAFGVTLTFDSTFNVAVSIGATTLEGSADSEAKFQVGAKDNTNNYISFGIDSASAAELDSGLVANMLDSQSKAFDALGYIDDAINELNGIRGDLGAVQNRLGYASANLATSIENYQAAESVIRDVDMASEMTEFTKNQILLQAGTAMLAQANMAPQQVLALFG